MSWWQQLMGGGHTPVPTAPGQGAPVVAKVSGFALRPNDPELRPVGRLEATCPYCETSLKKAPQRKTKCPNCGKPIFARTRATDRRKVLLREDELPKLERQWGLYALMRDFVPPQDLLDSKPWASLLDLRWAVLQREAMEYAARKDWGWHAGVLRTMAEQLLFERKTDHAIRTLMELAYLEANGPNNLSAVPRSFGIRYPAFDPKHAALSPELVGWIKKLADDCSLDRGALKSRFLEVARGSSERVDMPVSPETAWRKFEDIIGTIAT